MSRAIILSLLFSTQIAFGQSNSDTLTYLKVDSISYSLYINKNWKELTKVGRSSLNRGIDFPNLRLRLADAAIAQNHPSVALKHLDKAYESDATQAYMLKQYILSQRMLNNIDESRYFLSKTDSSTHKIFNQRKVQLLDQIFFDIGVIHPDDSVRNNLNLFRFGIQSRLNWRWMIYQSFQYYNQSSIVKVPPPPSHGPRRPIETSLPISQIDYYLRTRLQASRNLSFGLAYHFLQSNDNGLLELGYGGYFNIRRSMPYGTLNIDAGFSNYTNTHQKQIGISGKVFPFGNYSWYLLAGVDLLNNSDSGNVVIENFGTGIKLQKSIWTEFNISFGDKPNFVENNGEFIYNSIDLTQTKFDAIIYFVLTHHITLSVDYRFEKKQQLVRTRNTYVNYNQQGLIGELIWKL